MSRTAAIFATLILLSLNLVTQGFETEKSSYLSGAKGTNDPSWNYENHGSDWDFENCNITVAGTSGNGVQSPLAITTSAVTNDWGTYVPISFLTGWKKGSIKAEDHGVTNYTYRINATEGNLGVFYGVETYFSPEQIQWQVEQIRFKYPSEHTIDDKQYAMEMQVVLNDTLKRCNYCLDHTGMLSIFFDIGEDDPNTFWDFVGQETFDLDLSQVFNKTTSMSALMIGYGGSDSEPTCDQIRCWYLTVLPTPMTIPQAKFDALTSGATGLEWNNRATNLGDPDTYLQFKFPGLFYTAPTDEL